MSLSTQLRNTYSDEWNRSIDHGFVTELWSGELEETVFRHYLIQDYQFCDPFVALLGRAVSLAPLLDKRIPFARVLGEFASDENTFFSTAFDELKVSQKDRHNPRLGKATEKFLTLMRTVAAGTSYLDVLALLLVAEWLYGDWASRHELGDAPEQKIYSEWIRLHNNPSYNSWIVWLREEFDRAAEGVATDEREKAEKIFSSAVTLEEQFFDQAYEALP